MLRRASDRQTEALQSLRIILERCIRSCAPHFPKQLSYSMRGWVRTIVTGFTVVLILFLSGVAIWQGPLWLDGDQLLEIADASQRAAAVNSSRTLILQMILAAAGSLTVMMTVRNYLLSRSGQLADRYSKAAAQLASQQMQERIGAIHALARLMRDSPSDHRAIVNLLGEFVRERSGAAIQPDDDDQGCMELKDAQDLETGIEYSGPPVASDIQSALRVLAHRPRRFESPWISLGSSNLGGVVLSSGWLNRLHFAGSSMRGADLTGARSDCLVLTDRDLRAANLSGAKIPSTYFMRAQLDGALWRWCDLRRADFSEASLFNATFRDSDLTGADFEGADLSGASMEGVRGLELAQLACARLDSNTVLPDYIDKSTLHFDDDD